MDKITYVLCPITEIYLSRWFYTMYKFSKPDSFRVILVDQVRGGISKNLWDEIKDKVHLYIHPPHYQFGYSKAMNEGILHGLHWGSDLICLSNDDIEIINSKWIDGIHQTFALDPRIVGVVPMSPRIPGWGYNLKYNPDIIPYKAEYTEEDYNYLLEGDYKLNVAVPETFPKNMKGNVIDGSIFIMPYFKKEVFEKIGLLDEHYWPGSGEDMDFMARAYQKDMRIVSTSYSWIWHHLTKSKDLFASGELENEYYKPKHKSYWNNESDIWPDGFDAWGRDKDGKDYPRVPEVYVDVPQ
jgi:GT2 family glycosyltransferase